MYSIKLGDLNYDESLALAEKYKTEGNTFFQNNKFIEALEKYDQAINLKVETKNNAVYYSNRAYVNLKLENFGSAIQDVNMAIEQEKNSDVNVYGTVFKSSMALITSDIDTIS